MDWFRSIRYYDPGKGRDLIGAGAMLTLCVLLMVRGDGATLLFAIPCVPVAWMALRGRRWDHIGFLVISMVFLAPIAFTAALFLLMGGFLALVGENRTAFDFQILAVAGVFTVVAGRQFAVRAADGDDRWENPGRALLGVYGAFLMGLLVLLIQIPACAVLPSWLSWIRGALFCG